MEPGETTVRECSGMKPTPNRERITRYLEVILSASRSMDVVGLPEKCCRLGFGEFHFSDNAVFRQVTG